MIDGARQMNRCSEQCASHVNERDVLTLFGDETCDFIYSRIVLQHMRPAYAERYVHEFIRLLQPGGVAWFQVPSHQAPLPETLPLPDDAFQAVLTVPTDELTLRVGETIPFPVSVHNSSPVAWPGHTETQGHRDLALGNHWWKHDNSSHLFDDQRMRLPARLEPGATTDLVLMIAAPSDTGTYTLELDMVQEGVAWFGQKESPTLKLPVVVQEAVDIPVEKQESQPQGNSPAPSLLSPRMEMYGAKPQHVLAWIDAAGGRILEVGEDPAAGDRWYSYRYIVTR
jgi:SAM-dependent methyltransferase